ncbi:hypothetical protein BJG92_00079 [Arthrobacter sp. SO5]|uniref:hypothetical protein n=1 Tax=Arthrobacter sp. SO5 TaxID=1897055 RepID=UPI001E3C7BEE|nr:hypothetical protein [Arthrobacter sp. SO5]MCB5272577.1 hypothetical protein [Arthrobacter sp. SO5]
MKIQWTGNSFGRSGILAIAEKGDTQPPIDTIYLDYIVDIVDQDRLALAAALVFGAYAGNRIMFESPISVGVARAIEIFLRERTIRVDPVSYAENNSLHGDSIIMLDHSEAHTAPTNVLGRQRQIRVSILPTESNSGGLLTMDSLRVASNAWLHDQLRPPGFAEDRSSIAAAILLSADLSAAGINMCEPAGDGGSTTPDALRPLLESAGLSLVVQACCA